MASSGGRIRALAKALTSGSGRHADVLRPYLERLDLTEPKGLKQKLTVRLIANELAPAVLRRKQPDRMAAE